MTDYLQESAEALRAARRFAATASSPAINSDAAKADLHLRVAGGFARLAAIERGLLPPEMIPDTERAAS
jgi:hypothetical protein